jgi:hypothetical protein
MRLRGFLIAAICAIAMTSSVRADLMHYDVLVASDGAQLITGFYEDDVPIVANVSYGFPYRVFAGDLQAVTYGGDEPGVRALNSALLGPVGGTVLPGGEPLNARYLPMTIGSTSSNLFFWDGEGPVDFVNVPPGYTLNTEGDSGSNASADGTNTTSADFLIRNTSGTGTIHKHPDYLLDNGGLGDPAEGFYLVSYQFSMPGTTLADSLPIFMVFATPGADEERHEDAVNWVNDNLAAVPEPSTVLLTGLPLCVMGFLAARRRWRKAEGEVATAPAVA